MTEPIQGVTKAGEVERRGAKQERERLRRLHGEAFHHDEDAEADDTVDISEEARKRASGTYRKNILEHIEGDE